MIACHNIIVQWIASLDSFDYTFTFSVRVYV